MFRSLFVALLLLSCAIEPVPSSINQAIINGEFDSGRPAVVALLNGNIFFCSGVLISRRVILTAAHCVDPNVSGVDPSQLQIYFGPDISRGEGVAYPTAEAAIHPDFNIDVLINDIAVVVLDRDAPVEAMPFLKSPFHEGFLSQEITFVGFGADSLNRAGLKRKVEIPLVDFSDTQFFYQGDGNTCFGDSGGPAFLTFNGQETVVGVTSFGDLSCTEFGSDTRVDAFAGSFIQPFLDAEPPLEEESCGLNGTCNTTCNSPDPDCDLINCDGGNVCNLACPAIDPDCPDLACVVDDVCDDRCPNQNLDLDCICLDDGVCTDGCGEVDVDCKGADGGGGGCQVAHNNNSPLPLVVLFSLVFLSLLFLRKFFNRRIHAGLTSSK